MSDQKQRIFGLRSQVEKYFETQAQRLIEQALAASFLTAHSTVVGDAGEQALRVFLRNHFPNRYGIGTGHIVSFQDISAQIDTVIYDSLDCFKIPITEDATLYSIEGVYAAIEVKSSPKRRNMSGDIKNAVSNISTVRNLLHHPFYFSGLPTYNRFIDVNTKKSASLSYRPVCAIVILGSGGKFESAINTLKKEVSSGAYNKNVMPDLFCVLDERNFGLYGCDIEATEGIVSRKMFWREVCTSPGQTLALFSYWLLHKIILERITEQPIFHNTEQTTVWPAVMAPIISRMHINRDGSETSWGWLNETRQFEPE